MLTNLLLIYVEYRLRPNCIFLVFVSLDVGTSLIMEVKLMLNNMNSFGVV